MSFKKVVVCGSGVLGSQIAYQTAFKGFDVTIWLRSEGSIERAKPKLERLKNIYLETLEAMKTQPEAYCRGLSDKTDLTDEEIDELKQKAIDALDSLELTTSYEEAGNDADFIIEAIAEDPEQKIAFYTELQKHLPEKTVIATNSSTLLPSQFAEYTGRPEKYLALHFANNIWRSNTAEVMGHAGTDQKYYDQVVEFAKEIGMVPITLKKEQPAYVLNSLLVPFLSAAQMLWADDVADPEMIDLTWKLASGAPEGPFQIIDYVGLTTAYNISIMHPEANDPNSVQYKVVKKLKEKIDKGETGINAGKGFYEY